MFMAFDDSKQERTVSRRICMQVREGHFTCGYIASANLRMPGSSATFIWVDNTAGYSNLSSGGDSGGPWFLGNDAYGTHVGSPGDDNDDAVYMAVNYISAGIDVDVMTSP